MGGERVHSFRGRRPHALSSTLPKGFVVRLNKRVREYEGGQTLIGGTPTKVVYLTPRARSAMVDRTVCVVDPVSTRLADRLLELGMADPVVEALPAIDSSQVTFVVPAYERPEPLRRLLAGIEPGRRIIVVDDGSSSVDAIARVAASHHAELVALPTNVGPALARNAGLRRVKTPFVAFVDDDVVLDRDCIPTLLRHFNDPKVGMVAPRVGGLGGGPRWTWIQRYENARSSLDLGPAPSTVRPYAPVAWVPAACVVARVEAIQDGFSGDMRKGEDVDLVWRLVDQGWRVRYEASAHAYHENRAGTRQWLSRKAFYGSSADLLARRHPRKMAPAVFAPWSAGVAVALLAQRRWSLPVASLLSAVAAVRISKKVGRSKHPVRVAATLTADGVVVALEQAAGLLLRHWWPVTAVACSYSMRARRAILMLGIVDVAIEYRRTSPQLDPIRFGIARRLDDIAYGCGLWWGAIKGRSLRALLPDIRVTDQR